MQSTTRQQKLDETRTGEFVVRLDRYTTDDAVEYVVATENVTRTVYRESSYDLSEAQRWFAAEVRQIGEER